MRYTYLWVLLLIAPSLLVAQTKPQPSRRPVPMAVPESTAKKDSTERSTEAPLPKIDLPEYDITGTLVPGVGSASKLSGDGGAGLDLLGMMNRLEREPGWYDQGGWKASPASAVVPGARAGRVLVGYSSFQTPMIEGWYSPATEDYDMVMRAGYTSSGGHVENADYRRGHASFGLSWAFGEQNGILSRSTLGMSAAFAGQRYRLYGSSFPAQARGINHFASGVVLSGISWSDLRLDGSVSLSGTSLQDPLSAQQNRIGLALSLNRDGQDIDFEAGLDLAFGSYSGPVPTQDPLYSRLHFSARKEIVKELVLRLGLSGNVLRGSDEDFHGRLYPLASVSWYPKDGIEVFVRFQPTVLERTLADVLGNNPYVSSGPTVRNQEISTDVLLGTELAILRQFRVRLITQYQRMGNYLTFVDSAQTGVWLPWYEGTSSLVSVGGDLMWELTVADLISATVRSTLSHNSATGEKIPYVPAVRIDFGYAHWFPFGLRVTGDARLIGSRSIDLGDTRGLAPAFLVDAGAEYVFLPGWRAMGKLDNLLGAKFVVWDRYAGLPRSVSLAVGYIW